MATLPKPTTPTDAEQAIRALAQEYVKFANTRDIDKLVSLFTKDGVTMAPYRPAVYGPSQLHQHFQQEFSEQDPHDLRVETTHVEVAGNIGFSYGTFTLDVRMPSGKRIDNHGKWIATARRENGTWLIVGHCFNTDLPIETLTAV